jgi:hypothetical protein
MSENAHVTITNISTDDNTPEGIEARRVINEEIIPGLARTLVRVIVIHKPTNESTSFAVPLVDVRSAAEFAVSSFPRPLGIAVNPADFLVIEVFASGKTRVTTLEKMV